MIDQYPSPDRRMLNGVTCVSNTTPVHLVYRAGYSDNGYMVKTMIAEVAEVAEKEQGQFLGMIYIGPCLK